MQHCKRSPLLFFFWQSLSGCNSKTKSKGMPEKSDCQIISSTVKALHKAGYYQWISSPPPLFTLRDLFVFPGGVRASKGFFRAQFTQSIHLQKLLARKASKVWPICYDCCSVSLMGLPAGSGFMVHSVNPSESQPSPGNIKQQTPSMGAGLLCQCKQMFKGHSHFLRSTFKHTLPFVLK